MKGFLVAAMSAVLVVLQASALQFDKNVDPGVRQQFLEDLESLAVVAGPNRTPLHQQIFGMVDGAGYQKFFLDRVKKVGMDGCGSPNAVACVQPFWGSDTIWLTQNFVKFKHPQIARLMILFHEARHTERSNRFWMHARCPSPFLDDQGKEKHSIWTGAPLAGEDACDSTPFGAYGSSTILLKNVALHCESCNEKMRMDADLYATDQIERMSSKPAKEQMLNDYKQTFTPGA